LAEKQKRKQNQISSISYYLWISEGRNFKENDFNQHIEATPILHEPTEKFGRKFSINQIVTNNHFQSYFYYIYSPQNNTIEMII